jgi:hypothetical protein
LKIRLVVYLNLWGKNFDFLDVKIESMKENDQNNMIRIVNEFNAGIDNLREMVERDL